jgi:uncharacterized protein
LSLTPFQILVRDLPTKRELEIPASFVAEAVRGLPMREALGAPADDPSVGSGTLSLDLYSEGAHVFANGQMTGHVTVACSRCVEPVTLSFDEPVRVTFLPQAELPSTPDEPASQEEEDGLAITEDDLDLFGYDGEVVDLEPLVREQFVLVVPYAPLCKEACLGLCAQCGTNRNLDACTCEAPGDPRLAGLKALKFPS